MAKLIGVTKAGGAMLDDENDVKISINADNIKLCKPVSEGDVGVTEIVFNDGSTINVVETQKHLQTLINT